MAGDRGQTTQGWSNWSGNQTADQATWSQPADQAELSQILKTARQPIRVVGSGHSFTPIVGTAGTIINLDRISGVLSADADAQTARVHAGTRLYDLSAQLHEHGLAFRNLGDINVQSFAGAAATATHGTGKNFSCLAAEARAIKLMTASGEIIEADKASNPDLLHAAQVSLGALGIVLEAGINLQPAYNLHRKTWSEPIGEIVKNAPARWDAHRNYEFFYIPFSGYGINITHDETEAAETARAPSTDEEELAGLRRLRDSLKWATPVRRAALSKAMKNAAPEDTVGLSWRLLANERTTHFNEMEYHLPPENALGVLQDIIKFIETKRKDVFFPIEVRMTAGDEAWLSPFNGGARISVAVHTQAGEDLDWFYSAAEPIFREAGGRPHWGKLHSLGAEELSALYPKFEAFRALRKKLDPDGMFLTPALAKLWGVQR